MQEFSLLFKSVNKVSLIAFFIVLGTLIYEVYFLFIEAKRKQKLSVPNFSPDVKIEPAAGETIKENVVGQPKSVNKILIIILILLLIIFGTITVVSIFSPINKQEAGAKSKVIIQTVNSKGIIFFDKQWNIFDSEKIKGLKPFDQIIIGIETIPEADIDRARIKVNGPNWKVDHITSKFNKQYNIYYREYQIATDEYKIKIDAQLHSKQDGWLGD